MACEKNGAALETESVKELLSKHQEALILIGDASDSESTIVVYTKLLPKGHLSRYLKQLLENISRLLAEKSCGTEGPHCRSIETSTTAVA